MPKAPGRYAVIGYVVSKFVWPVASRRMKRKLRTGAVDGARNGVGKLARNPVRTSLAVGSAIGAATWLVKHRPRRDRSRSGRD